MCTPHITWYIVLTEDIAMVSATASDDDWRSILETLLVYEDVNVLDSMRRSLRQIEDGDVVEFDSPLSLKARRGK